MFDGWKKWYDDVERNYQDPRTVGWFMVGSPVEGIIICLAYVLLVTVIGPRYMKNREPMNIRGLMVVYNFLMVGLSALMMFLFLKGGWATSYTLGCVLVDPSRSPEAMTMVMACYLFYLSKFIELMDTVFFVLRKKFQLVTFLHVFHHAIMPCSWWIAVKFSPGGMGTFHALLNCFIHFCMYIYYGIAAMGPQYQKYIWWKKYMTKLQMVQFVSVMLHSSQQFFTDCPYPMLFAYWIFLYAVIFLVLFANFYIQAYRKRLSSNKTKSVATNTASNGGCRNGHEKNGVHHRQTSSNTSYDNNGYLNGNYTNGVKCD